ncbi:MAG: DUF262 domain-containing protein [Prevotella sp.]|nr:DUF262 domain-containing protein [Prevotella sp.]
MNLKEIFENKLKIETKVVSIESVFSEVKVKKTQYAPPYQRNYVWDGEKATYFLESILIGTEIPPLIFFRSKGGVEIIDGRQRYETILKFLNGELRLSKAGLKKLDGLNIDKKTFGSLPDEMKNDFWETKLRVIEFSFASHDGITKVDEDSVKQEIFKRYNSGITPLKEIEIDKAIYFDDDLNSFFKEKLQEEVFHDQFNRLFKYEEKKIDISLKKIRQLLVIHKIPIKYYSKAKQKITDKYYDLLSARIDSEEFEGLFESFKKKMDLLDEVRKVVDTEETPYNRLISEVLFWGFSILEDNGKDLPEKNSIELAEFSTLIGNNMGAFEMDRSSFATQIVNRYRVVANFLSEVYDINKDLYIETDDQFKQKNRELGQTKETGTTNFQELRINKPEPSTYTIEDICLLMDRNRFLVRPAYQREEVINKRKSSEIIESLLLGIKLPPIFIYKNNAGVSEVIDGQQRILSILAYIGRGYMNEKGEKVKSNKDGFALQLKDSILTDLHGKHFEQLDEYQQDIITNFDLWVIEIHQKNNPDFEPLDLFIRLNNKPYPIKDDTFEMWNSYLDRGLIDTIKASYSNNANWFFMRRTGNRMENENNYTVLSYFKYLEMHPEEGSEKGALDIYKLFGRISFRLRSKREISKILENAGKKDAFVEAVNQFEFKFISNLRTLLSDEKDNNDKTLSKNLDELLGVENNKRTQQSFYVLWYFLHGLDSRCFKENSMTIRQEVRELFNSMSEEGITVEIFNAKVDKFREKYKSCGDKETMYARMKDVLAVYSFDPENSIGEPTCDFYVLRDNKMLRRVQIIRIPPMNKDDFIGVRLSREDFTQGYVEAVLQSSYVFKEYDFMSRTVTAGTLKSIKLPVLPLEKQKMFDKVMVYAESMNKDVKMLFEGVLDRMVEEVYHQDVFLLQDFTLFDMVAKLEDLSGLDKEEREKRMRLIRNEIVHGKTDLLSGLSVATGITGTYGIEKDK